jgi:hypothetical protein
MESTTFSYIHLEVENAERTTKYSLNLFEHNHNDKVNIMY